jgi:hypothetical protein
MQRFQSHEFDENLWLAQKGGRNRCLSRTCSNARSAIDQGLDAVSSSKGNRTRQKVPGLQKKVSFYQKVHDHAGWQKVGDLAFSLGLTRDSRILSAHGEIIWDGMTERWVTGHSRSSIQDRESQTLC